MQADFSPTYIGMRGVPNDDKLTSLYTEPAYIDAVKFGSKLFREKLMTQKKEQVNEKLKTGRVAIYVSYSVLEPLMSEGKTLLKSQDPEVGYEEIWPIHTEDVPEGPCVSEQLKFNWMEFDAAEARRVHIRSAARPKARSVAYSQPVFQAFGLQPCQRLSLGEGPRFFWPGIRQTVRAASCLKQLDWSVSFKQRRKGEDRTGSAIEILIVQAVAHHMQAG